MKIKAFQMALFKILFLSANIVCVLNVFQYHQMISILLPVIFMLVVVLTVMSFYSKRNNRTDVVLLLLLIVFVLCNSTLSLLLSERTASMNFYNKTIVFIMTVALLFSVNRLLADQRTVTFIERTITFTTIAFIIMYFFKHNEVYVYTNLGIKYLYFNFQNPNFTAMHFLIFGIYNLILAEKRTKIITRLFHWSLALFMFYFILETLSRNALLIEIGFAIIFFYTKFRKKQALSFSKTVSMVVAAWPLIFAFLYIVFIHTISNSNFLSFLVGIGKELDSRIGVWNIALAEIKKSPLIGNYGFSLLRQSHNTHLDIWVSYGTIVLATTIIFIKYIIHNNGYTYRTRTSYLYMLGFICCILMGMGEAALFSGSQALFVLIGGFVLLSKSKDDNDVKDVHLKKGD